MFLAKTPCTGTV